MQKWQRVLFSKVCEWAKFDSSVYSDDEIEDILYTTLRVAPMTMRELQVIQFCFVEGMTKAECARQLDISSSAVYNTYEHARRKIIEWSGIKAGKITITSNNFADLTLYAAGLEKQICRELSRSGIYYVHQLTVYTEDEMRHKPHIGPVHFNKLKDFMEEYNIKFKPNVPEPEHVYCKLRVFDSSNKRHVHYRQVELLDLRDTGLSDDVLSILAAHGMYTTKDLALCRYYHLDRYFKDNSKALSELCQWNNKQKYRVFVN